MKLEYVEKFVDATARVLEQVLQTSIGHGEVCLVEGKETRGEITVAIPLGGELEGMVSLQLSRETAVKLFNHVAGKNDADLPLLGLDYLKELGNMIAGAAASALKDEGYEVTVAPPLADDDPSRPGLLEIEACRIPIFSAFGSMSVNIVLATA